MSRQEELKCLEKVKCGISEEYYLNKQIGSHSFGQRMECNYYCKESGRIAEALINAKENPNENDFPDFIVVGGFIEHFTVSAAKENRQDVYKRQPVFHPCIYNRFAPLPHCQIYLKGFLPLLYLMPLLL